MYILDFSSLLVLSLPLPPFCKTCFLIYPVAKVRQKSRRKVRCLASDMSWKLWRRFDTLTLSTAVFAVETKQRQPHLSLSPPSLYLSLPTVLFPLFCALSPSLCLKFSLEFCIFYYIEPFFKCSVNPLELIWVILT